MNFRLYFILVLLVFLIVCGCAQRETDIGTDAITNVPGNNFAVLTGTATHSADWHPPYTNGGGTSLEIGDARELYAFAAIKFDAKNGLPDSVVVDKMWIRLCRLSDWPNGSVPGLQVRVRQIPDSVTWSEGNLIPGTLSGREFYPIVDSLVASGSDSFLVDTLPNPQELWNAWHADTSNSGLVIEARSNSPGGSGAFIEYYSHENDSLVYRPTLFIHGRAWVGDTVYSPDTTVSTYAIDDGYLTIDSTDIDPTSHAEHAGHILITEGMAQRGAVYFPVDTIVSNFTRSVSRAELHLFADTLSPLRIPLEGQTIPLNHGFLNTKAWITEPDSFFHTGELGLEAGQAGYGVWVSGSAEVIFDVTNAVYTWIADSSKNGGLQVFPLNEFGTLEREAFFGADAADSTKRPKLYIWYTEVSH